MIVCVNPVFAGALRHRPTARRLAYQMRRGESSAIYSDNFYSRTICTCCTTMAATVVSDVGDCRRPVAAMQRDASNTGHDDQTAERPEAAAGRYKDGDVKGVRDNEIISN